MKYLVIIIAILSISTATGSKADRALVTCAPSSGVTLQVLGSGGPVAGTGKLVLSHFMAHSLENTQQSLEIIRSRYAGPLVSSNDLQCINF